MGIFSHLNISAGGGGRIGSTSSSDSLFQTVGHSPHAQKTVYRRNPVPNEKNTHPIGANTEAQKAYVSEDWHEIHGNLHAAFRGGL